MTELTASGATLQSRYAYPYPSLALTLGPSKKDGRANTFLDHVPDASAAPRGTGDTLMVQGV